MCTPGLVFGRYVSHCMHVLLWPEPEASVDLTPEEQQLYNNREQCRDAFYAVMRDAAAVLPPGGSTMLHLDRATSQLASANPSRDVASTGEADPEVTNLAGGNSGRLQRLHQRLTSAAHPPPIPADRDPVVPTLVKASSADSLAAWPPPSPRPQPPPQPRSPAVASTAPSAWAGTRGGFLSGRSPTGGGAPAGGAPAGFGKENWGASPSERAGGAGAPRAVLADVGPPPQPNRQQQQLAPPSDRGGLGGPKGAATKGQSWSHSQGQAWLGQASWGQAPGQSQGQSQRVGEPAAALRSGGDGGNGGGGGGSSGGAGAALCPLLPRKDLLALFPEGVRAYVAFLELADSHQLGLCVRSTLLARIAAFTQHGHCSGDGAWIGSSSGERALVLKTLALFLGYLSFSFQAAPQAHPQPPPGGDASHQPQQGGGCAGVGQGPVDVEGVSQQASRDGSLLLNLPWLLDYVRLLQLDAGALRLGTYDAAVGALAKLYCLPMLQPASAAFGTAGEHHKALAADCKLVAAEGASEAASSGETHLALPGVKGRGAPLTGLLGGSSHAAPAAPSVVKPQESAPVSAVAADVADDDRYIQNCCPSFAAVAFNCAKAAAAKAVPPAVAAAVRQADETRAEPACRPPEGETTGRRVEATVEAETEELISRTTDAALQGARVFAALYAKEQARAALAALGPSDTPPHALNTAAGIAAEAAYVAASQRLLLTVAPAVRSAILARAAEAGRKIPPQKLIAAADQDRPGAPGTPEQEASGGRVLASHAEASRGIHSPVKGGRNFQGDNCNRNGAVDGGLGERGGGGGVGGDAAAGATEAPRWEEPSGAAGSRPEEGRQGSQGTDRCRSAGCQSPVSGAGEAEEACRRCRPDDARGRASSAAAPLPSPRQVAAAQALEVAQGSQRCGGGNDLSCNRVNINSGAGGAAGRGLESDGGSSSNSSSQPLPSWPPPAASTTRAVTRAASYPLPLLVSLERACTAVASSCNAAASDPDVRLHTRHQLAAICVALEGMLGCIKGGIPPGGIDSLLCKQASEAPSSALALNLLGQGAGSPSGTEAPLLKCACGGVYPHPSDNKEFRDGEARSECVGHSARSRCSRSKEPPEAEALSECVAGSVRLCGPGSEGPGDKEPTGLAAGCGESEYFVESFLAKRVRALAQQLASLDLCVLLSSASRLAALACPGRHSRPSCGSPLEESPEGATGGAEGGAEGGGLCPCTCLEDAAFALGWRDGYATFVPIRALDKIWVKFRGQSDAACGSEYLGRPEGPCR
eukprot:jgi/Mesen1/6157/ME000314S05156